MPRILQWFWANVCSPYGRYIRNRRHAGQAGGDFTKFLLMNARPGAGEIEKPRVERGFRSHQDERSSVAWCARGTRLSLVDAERATAKILAIQRLNRGVGIGIVHFNEAKAARASGFPIGNELHGAHFTVSREQVSNLLFRGGKGEVSDIDRLHKP